MSCNAKFKDDYFEKYLNDFVKSKVDKFHAHYNIGITDFG